MIKLVRRFDTWIGMKLFVPIIIRICQITKTTQYVFSDYTGLIGWTCTFGLLTFDHFFDYILAVFFLYMIIGYMARIIIVREVTARIAEKEKRRGNDYFEARYIVWSVIVVMPLVSFTSNQWWPWSFIVAVGVVFLFEYYAMDIDSIPPSESKKKQLKESFST